jgi:hypothetical protein
MVSQNDMAKAPGVASLDRARGAMDEVDRVLHLSMGGISQIAKIVPLLLNMENYRQGWVEFAQKELDRGFPVLHSHAIVALWGILEATIEDFVIEFLEYNTSSLAHPSLASIRVPLAEFEQLDKTDRLRLLLAEYGCHSKADLKQGVTRFETFLDLVRLSGGVDENLRRNLFEHQQVRNAIVHRAGLADRRLVVQCPWLNLKVGGPIHVSHSEYLRYHDAMSTYLTELVIRTFVRKGMSREQAEVEGRKQLEQNKDDVSD